MQQHIDWTVYMAGVVRREVPMRRRTQLVFLAPALSASAIVTAVAALSFWLRYAL